MVLLGPMGYSGAVQSIIRIMIAQFFPLKSIQESTFSWAFSDSEKLQKEFGEWFQLMMSETQPQKVAPMQLTKEERQRIRVPVLFVFGEKDNLVGNPETAKQLVQDMSDVEIRIVPAGHLMGGEILDQINAIILDYFE